jgi:hypothetical protein
VTTFDVRLRAEWLKGIGYRYDVIFEGEVIVCRSRDPEHDAARILEARGFRGRFRTIDARTGRLRMVHDIVKAARLRTIERDDGGLIVVPYRRMTEEDKIRARLQRAGQGPLFMGEVAIAAGQPVQRRGDESAARKSGPLYLAADDERAFVPVLEHEDA